jgi:hypothetical protein
MVRVVGMGEGDTYVDRVLLFGGAAAAADEDGG